MTLATVRQAQEVISVSEDVRREAQEMCRRSQEAREISRAIMRDILNRRTWGRYEAEEPVSQSG